MVALGFVVVVLVGGGGTAGACKLFLDCRIGNHVFGPNSVSDYAGKGSGNMELPPDLSVNDFAKGFHFPTDLAFLPDGRLLVASKDGLIDVVAKNGGTHSTFLDLRSRVNTSFFRGALNVAVDPEFRVHPYVYVTYTAIGEGGESPAATVVRVSRFRVTEKGADPASERVIIGRAGRLSCLAVPATADCLPSEVDHNGSDIAFAPDGTMFISTGDGGGEERVEQVALRAQNIDTLGGKVLHVDRNGMGLADNPYWDGDPQSNRSKVWAVGLRNPFRMTLLAGKESAPLVADVGWTNWERLVFAARGANLGWPCYEATEKTQKYRETEFCKSFYTSHPEAPTEPWFALPHPAGGSITGGVSLAGASALPRRLREDYVFGDWVTSRISLLPLGMIEGRPVDPVVMAQRAAGPSAFAIGPDGALYYLAANLGEVRRIRSASQ